MAARLMRRFYQVTQKGKRPKQCSHILTRRAPLTTNLRLAKLARGINARVRANNSPQTLARSSRRRSVVGELGSWVDRAAALFARCVGESGGVWGGDVADEFADAVFLGDDVVLGIVAVVCALDVVAAGAAGFVDRSC
jgi:hypothetical protein